MALDYYITNNNTINDIFISNPTKLYNITSACSFIEDFIFEKPLTFKNKNKKFNIQKQEQEILAFLSF
jgi:hypothetical protein